MLLLPLLLLPSVVCSRSEVEYETYNIGAVLSVGDKIATFLQAIEDVNAELNILPPRVHLFGVSLPMDRNPIRTAQNVCKNLISAQVTTVIL